MKKIIVKNSRANKLASKLLRYVVIIILSLFWSFAIYAVIADSVIQWIPNKAELVGEWELSDDFKYLPTSNNLPKFILNEDGTCDVIHIPISVEHRGHSYNIVYSYIDKGADMTQIYSNNEWNFHGYWNIETCPRIKSKKKYVFWGDRIRDYEYHYFVTMSPSKKILEKSPQDISNTKVNKDYEITDLYSISLQIRTDVLVLFPPRRARFLDGDRMEGGDYDFRFIKTR